MQGLGPGHIAIANSSTQLTYNIFQVLLDPGDSILILDPSYCNIPIQAVMSMENVSILRFPVLNNKAWTYEASEKKEEFRNYILEKKPKVILLISPDNPTSQVLTDEFITAAHEAACETGAYLVIDFAYKELVFQQQYPRYYSWAPDENFLSLHSNSKWSRSLGRRLGWIEGPEEVIAALESFQNASMLCPDMLHQMALSDYFSTALSNGSFSKYITETAAKYENAAKVTVDMVKEYLDFPVLTPRGGLYTIMDVGENGISFVERVLKNTAVLFVPGWGFGRSMLNAVRISYGPMVENPEKIRIAMERVKKYLKS
jgi:aspartate/methionine/tyrosine aminotransferase